MNSTLIARAMMRMKAMAIVARRFKSLRTNGSRIRDQFMKVYSLYPSNARIGSSLYTYEMRKYVPRVKGRIIWAMLVAYDNFRSKNLPSIGCGEDSV
jgi:hypothetical protein